MKTTYTCKVDLGGYRQYSVVLVLIRPTNLVSFHGQNTKEMLLQSEARLGGLITRRQKNNVWPPL